MFSTLLGPLPSIEDPVRALEDIGLELLASGAPPPDPATPPRDVVAGWRATADGTEHPVKQAVLGPYAAGTDAVEALAETIAALANAGCPFVDVVEPDLSPIVVSSNERARFVDAHRALFATLGSSGATIHCSLVVGGGNLDPAGPAAFFDLPYPSYAFDLIDGPDNWRLIAAAPTDRGIVCGALSSRAGGDETREVLVWAAQYAASTGGRGIERVGLANAGSLAALPPEVALRKLRRVAEAARIAGLSSEELAAQLDPRAFGGRRNRPGGPASRYHPSAVAATAAASTAPAPPPGDEAGPPSPAGPPAPSGEPSSTTPSAEGDR
jgi:hypothetical protein